MIISTKDIYEAITYYQKCGYYFLDVPYLVDSDVSVYTAPTDKVIKDLVHLNKHYVASAEQSFIQLQKQNKLPAEGSFMALTPCYRTEPILDHLHYNIFLKLELISIKAKNYKEIAKDADSLFNKYFRTTIIPTSQNSLDIYASNIEIGSYGERIFLDGTSYMYGTGYAEPRMSIIKTNLKN